MIKKIGVIGAGQMGAGIAHVAALSGFEVIMSDISMDRANIGLTLISKNMERQVKKEVITGAEKDAALARIKTTTKFKDFGDCDLVVEAATETLDLKLKILGEVCKELSEKAILTTNTSSISITRLGAATDRPAKFMGMHFMNPVPLMKLVELIPGIATDQKTFDMVQSVAKKMGKTPTTSKDFPGFLANRILMPMINEAIFALYEGVGSVEAIDTTMKLGTNQPMGPLTLADFIGLDTCLAIMQVLYNGFSDSKYRPCPLLIKYVEAGWLGRKSGKGFYDYSGDAPIPTR